MSSVLTTAEITNKRTSLIWVPYFILALLLLGLAFASFLKYHFKNRHKYRERAQKMKESREEKNHWEIDRVNSIVAMHSRQNGETMWANLTPSSSIEVSRYDYRSDSVVSISEGNLLKQSYSNPAFSSIEEKRESPEGSCSYISDKGVSLHNIGEENRQNKNNVDCETHIYSDINCSPKAHFDINDNSEDNDTTSMPIGVQNNTYTLSNLKKFSSCKQTLSVPTELFDEVEAVTNLPRSQSLEEKQNSLEGAIGGHKTAIKKFQLPNKVTLPEPNFSSLDNDNLINEYTLDDSMRAAVDFMARERIRQIQSIDEDGLHTSQPLPIAVPFPTQD